MQLKKDVETYHKRERTSFEIVLFGTTLAISNAFLTSQRESKKGYALSGLAIITAVASGTYSYYCQSQAKLLEEQRDQVTGVKYTVSNIFNTDTAQPHNNPE